MNSGVYAIVNKLNGHRYIGSSSSLKQRRSCHWSSLRGGYHRNAHLQAAWNKYEEENFEFVVLIDCPVEQLLDREQEYLDAKPEYNLSGIAGRIEPTEETRKKISEAAKNRVFSDETRRKLSESHRAENLSEETRRKLSESHMGNKGRTGQPLSEEHNIKCHKVHLGNKYQLGRKHTEEERAKMRAARVGRKPALGLVHTDATKEKMSIASKKAWAERKKLANAAC